MDRRKRQVNNFQSFVEEQKNKKNSIIALRDKLNKILYSQTSINSQDLLDLMGEIETKEDNALEKYELLQAFRYMATKENLKYRVLVNDTVLTLSSEEFLQYIGFSENKLYLLESALKNDLNSNILKENIDSEGTVFYKMMKAQLEAEGIIEKQDNNRYRIKDNSDNWRSHSDGSYKTYNEGDLFENIDRLFMTKLSDEERGLFKQGQINTKDFNTIFKKMNFNSEFRHDSSKGLTSGDYSVRINDQVTWFENKANQATLMSYNTIDQAFNRLGDFFSIFKNNEVIINEGLQNKILEILLQKGEIQKNISSQLFIPLFT